MNNDLASLITALNAPKKLPSSLRGAVKVLLPAIENALDNGYKFRDIAELLNEYGVDVSAEKLSATVRKVRMLVRAEPLPSTKVTATPIPSTQTVISQERSPERIEVITKPVQLQNSTTLNSDSAHVLPSKTIDQEIDLSKYDD